MEFAFFRIEKKTAEVKEENLCCNLSFVEVIMTTIPDFCEELDQSCEHSVEGVKGR